MVIRQIVILCYVIAILISCYQHNNIIKRIEGIDKKILNLRYSTFSETQKLDLYLPTAKGKLFPVVIYIHGGGFRYGDKRDRYVLPILKGLKKGYAIVSINYRLSGESIFPANIYDVKTAIRWVKVNASTYNLDPKKIALWGASAGGNLAALAGTSAEVKDLEDLSLGHSTYSSRVQAVVVWYAPINFLTIDKQLIQAGMSTSKRSSKNSYESRNMGAPITTIPNQVRRANPETYITNDDPPFFIQHGDKDLTVPVQQSRDFYTKLTNTLGYDKVKFEEFKGATHGDNQFKSINNIDKIFTFLDKVLDHHLQH